MAADAPPTALDGSGEEGGEEDVLVDELQLPLWERPGWSDLEPLHLVDSTGVVAIDYDAHHVQALGYFRAILQRGELSPRALELTAEMISLNQADYTAWEWRWRCLRALQVDLRVEYLFTDPIMRDNAKNYQLWNHRRKCALALGGGAARRELEVAAEALAIDAKNYHAWAHRQAIVAEFGGALWEEELAYLEQRIRDDLRNNSAWNQRAFVLTHQLRQLAADGGGGAAGPGGGVEGAAGEVADGGELPPTNAAAAAMAGVVVGPALRALLLREVRYVAAQVARAPRNESAWNYLTGLFGLPGVPPLAMVTFDEVVAICRDALLHAPSSPCALDLFATYYEQLAHMTLKQLAALPPAPPAPQADDPMTTDTPAPEATPDAAGSPPVAAADDVQPPLQEDEMLGLAGAAAGGDAGEGGGGGGAAAAEEEDAGLQGVAFGGPEAPLPPAVAARVALETAVGSSMILLESLTIADPVRVMYWRHRQQGVQELLQVAAALGGGAAGGEAQQQGPAGGAGAA